MRGGGLIVSILGLVLASLAVACGSQATPGTTSPQQPPQERTRSQQPESQQPQSQQASSQQPQTQQTVAQQPPSQLASAEQLHPQQGAMHPVESRLPLSEPSPSPQLQSRQAASQEPSPQRAPAGGTGTPATAPAGPPLVAFLGDSLTAGLGLAEDQAFPALLGARLEKEGVPVRVVNAGVSGDTTAGGLRRVEWILEQHPDVIVVELGGNDGLRGLPLAETEKNLREIVTRARSRGASVLLAGMLIPTSYGPDYAESFASIYPRIAREMQVPLVPFLLAGVGGIESLNQPDGIHPTAQGHEIVADNVLPYLRDVLKARARRRATATRCPSPNGVVV